MRRFVSSNVGTETEFLVHFENAVELRHQRPVGGSGLRGRTCGERS